MLSRLSSCHGKPPHLLLQRLPQLIRRPVPDANRVQQRHVNDLAKLEHLHVPALGAELGQVALLRGLVGLQLVVLPAQLLLLLAQRSTLLIQLLQAQRARRHVVLNVVLNRQEHTCVTLKRLGRSSVTWQ